MGEYTWIGIWSVIIAAVFGWAWRKGHLLRISKYVGETKEELRKCSWPTRQELKGSTAVVMVSIALFGFFTVLVDQIVLELGVEDARGVEQAGPDPKRICVEVCPSADDWRLVAHRSRPYRSAGWFKNLWAGGGTGECIGDAWVRTVEP